ncbi:MAG: hypothetical protein ACYC3S_02065 [Chloroflexota bacterium]
MASEQSNVVDLDERPASRMSTSMLDIRTVLVASVFLIAFALAAQPRIDVDLGWHLRTGQIIWETGAIPHADPFSYTVSGQPWITHEWLSEVIMYPLYAAWGFGGLIGFFACVIVASLWLVFRQMREEGVAPVPASLVLLLGGLGAMDLWGTRPLVFTMLLAPLYALLLRRWWRGDSRGLLALPPLMALWVNLHGGYMFGLGLIGLYAAAAVAGRWFGPDQARGSLRHLLLAGAACLLATLANPNTYQILWYPFDTLTSAAMRKYLTDWPSPDFHQLRMAPFAIMLGLFFLAAVRAGRRLSIADTFVFVALAALGLQSNRHVPLFALVTTPILARWLAALRDDFATLWRRSGLAARYHQANRSVRPSRLLLSLNALILVAAIVGAGVRVAESLPNEASLKVQREYFPADALTYMRQNNIGGRVYNAYNWGGYLVLQGYPQQLVFIDSRADVYRDAFIEDYLETYYVGPQWRDALERYNVEYVLVESKGPLQSLLVASKEWRELYRDDVAVLLARAGS